MGYPMLYGLTMLDIIGDIERALQGKAYFSALALSLAIVEKCAKVENDGDGGKINYSKWADKHLFEGYKDHDRKTSFGKILPYMNGEILYQLRCSMLHDVSSGLDYNRITDKENKLSSFVLIIVEYNEFLPDSIHSVNDQNEKEIDIYIEPLCHKICEAAKQYYEKNKDKFKGVIRVMDCNNLLKESVK